MKKTLIIIAAISLMLLGMSSCKTTNDCPAYGSSANTAEIEHQA